MCITWASLKMLLVHQHNLGQYNWDYSIPFTMYQLYTIKGLVSSFVNKRLIVSNLRNQRAADGLTDGQTDRRTDRQKDGQTDRLLYNSLAHAF